MDKETKEPIAFVNIGVVGKSMGTVSNDFGQFNVNLSEGSKEVNIIKSYDNEVKKYLFELLGFEG